ncbi:hypothetical protein E1218_30570 [Kribbella turkmenica]|uniref:MAM domain-containing protein n=1 Tax=Kribbella turkmenica TaxID=2530375 RepID=A0A4R4WHZ9_9ACTN|nr:hypothetical protein [Kribbella turkmenica]TDD15974.1 hypothetical protein E1218_30570 [Kribbella turkmenica]
MDATGGVGNDVRFDFASVAIFDDGRVAVSFLDSTTTSPSTTNPDRKGPAVAIEGATTLGAKLRPEPELTPELGTPYAAFDFESGNQDWTTGGTPTWTRSAPGAGTDGTDDPNGTAFAMAGPTQYVDNADATLESPLITAPAGPAVLAFQLKTDTEQGFDTMSAQWSADGTTWEPIATFSGRNTGYPSWQQVTLGFTSPAGQIRVRFQFTSDLACSALTPACGEFTGVHVDNVIVGSQATKN